MVAGRYGRHVSKTPRGLRALVKLIEKGSKKVVHMDFEDELGTETKIDLPEIANGLDMVKFKGKGAAPPPMNPSFLAANACVAKSSR